MYKSIIYTYFLFFIGVFIYFPHECYGIIGETHPHLVDYIEGRQRVLTVEDPKKVLAQKEVEGFISTYVNANVLEEIFPQASVSEDSYKPSKTADGFLSLTALDEEDSPDSFTPQDQVGSESAGPENEENQEASESDEFGNEILAGAANEEEQETEQESFLQPSQNSSSPLRTSL